MPAKKSKLKHQYLVYFAVALGLAGLLYYFKSQFVVAWVDGRPITRIAYARELEKLAKNQAMDSLLTKQLINNEAKKQNVTVGREEVNETLAKIEERAKSQGTNLEELLEAQKITRPEVEAEIRLQKLLEKMAGEVTVGEDAVNTYWEENQALYSDQTLDEVKAEIEEQLKQQELLNKIQELIARLQTEAKVVQWLN